MVKINPLVSNGTCYFAGSANKTTSNIIPCGNAALENYACCQEGDFCLESSFCYNSNHSTTYMAGCTDPDFSSPSCPSKGSFLDQELLSFVQCEDTIESSSVVWSPCPGPTSRTAIGANAACTCTGTDGLLTASTSLAATATLPTALHETIKFAKGHTPSLSSAATTSTAANGQVTTVFVPATATSSGMASASTIASSSSGSTLSTGAKAGIGVGAAALGVGLIGLAVFAFTRFRRARNNKNQPPQQQPGANLGHPDEGPMGSPPPMYASSAALPHQQQQPWDNKSAVPMMGQQQMGQYPGYAGFKSELPAGNMEMARPGELDAGQPYGGGAGGASPFASPAPTGHASLVSEREDYSRSPSVAYAPSQVSLNHSDAFGPASTGRGQEQHMGAIAELHG